MDDRLDILIFGATGFTGIHCIPFVANLTKSNGRFLSWGVAGRSQEKLENALKSVAEKHGKNFESIPIVIADVNDYDSLVKMAKRTKLVINCCGPYRFYGDTVVKACIEAQTHHVDVSGEPEYMERVQVEQHEAALEKGVYVISACGLDSIPADLGTIFVQQNFNGTMNSVETYLRAWNEGPVKGSIINYGTWESAVHSVSNVGELQRIRKKFFEKFPKAPTFPPKLKRKALPHKPGFVDGWALPFLGSDCSVARRSQSYLYENENIRPAQVGTYFVLNSLFEVFGILVFGIVFGLLTRFEFGKRVLLNYPAIFSLGYITKKPPSEQTIRNSWFSIDFFAKGWKDKAANKEEQFDKPMDKLVRACVKGQNPGYGSTCLALVLSAIMVLTETKQLANNGKGGVYPPGAAFAKTSLVKELNDNGLTFEIISEEDLLLRSSL